MSRKLLEAYYTRIGYHVDAQGNIVLDPSEYKGSDDNLPKKKVIDPEQTTAEDEDAAMRDHLLSTSTIQFTESKTGNRVRPRDMVEGDVYLTPDHKPFIYDGTTMLFLSKVVPTTSITESGLKVIGTVDVVYQDREWIVVVTDNPGADPILAMVRSVDGKVSPVISYFIRPANQEGKPMRIPELESMGSVFKAEDESGAIFIGKATAENLVEHPEGGYAYSGKLWATKPLPAYMTQASKISSEIKVVDYLSREP